MPSTSPSSPRNRPNSVLFLTSPSTTVPGGYFSMKTSQGLRMVCLRPSEMRRLTGSTSSTCTSTSWDVETILPGGRSFGPRHFGDVDEAFDAGLELDEGAVVGDVGDAALEAGAHRELGLDALPRIGLKLLHAERDAVGLVVDLDDLDLHLLADIEHLGGVIDAPPGDVGDMQQAVDAAEIDEGAVIGDVLDHAVDDLALFEVLHQLLALLGAGLFEHGAARHDDVAAAAVHLEDLELLIDIHQRADVADRPDVDLGPRQERHRAVEIDGEAALDLVEDDAL